MKDEVFEVHKTKLRGQQFFTQRMFSPRNSLDSDRFAHLGSSAPLTSLK